MRIRLDQGTPVPLRRSLPEHTVSITYEQGWATIANGQLLTRAEGVGYDLLITTDQSLRYQQNLTPRRIAIVVLRSTSWPRIQTRLDVVRTAVGGVPSARRLGTLLSARRQLSATRANCRDRYIAPTFRNSATRAAS